MKAMSGSTLMPASPRKARLAGDGSGTSNYIGNLAGTGLGIQNSFIGGGSANCIDDGTAVISYGVIGGGNYNCIAPGTSFASVFNGQNNCICAATDYASIFSGQNNCVAGNYSSILGGSGNSDGGIPYVGIFGCNITGVMPCAFHANEFVAQNMPGPYTGGPLPAPTGGLFYCIDGLTGLCHVLIA